jgi:hypothetical protein
MARIRAASILRHLLKGNATFLIVALKQLLELG